MTFACCRDRSVEDILEERIFNSFIGMLLGPKDLPVFRRSITSETSWGAAGVIKNE